jgi:hypothetical protein
MITETLKIQNGAQTNKKRKRYGTAQGPGNARHWREQFGGRMSDEEAASLVGHRIPWEILGVSAGVTWKSVVSRYRILATATQPDRILRIGLTPEQGERQFKELGAAMQILARAYGEDRP